jgi:hypothetical protein
VNGRVLVIRWWRLGAELVCAWPGHSYSIHPRCPIKTLSSQWVSILQGSSVRSNGRLTIVKLNDDAGALRATNNRGLQPAMDFILEHNDDPIPDFTSGAVATSSAARPQTGPMDEDEDEDTAALRAAYGLKAGAAGETDSGAGVEARVSRRTHRWQLVIHI